MLNLSLLVHPVPNSSLVASVALWHIQIKVTQIRKGKHPQRPLNWGTMEQKRRQVEQKRRTATQFLL